jgi:hypothetical protein
VHKLCWPYESKDKLSTHVQHINLRLRFGYQNLKLKFTMEVTHDINIRDTLKGINGFKRW